MEDKTYGTLVTDCGIQLIAAGGHGGKENQYYGPCCG